MKSDAVILDACCGSRMIWFDKYNPSTIYMDSRELDCTLQDGRPLHIHPDVIGDFRNMPFEDGRFKMVVFDPPHLLSLGEDSWLAKKYGRLSDTWKDDLKQGFDECMRVLQHEGILILKWSERDISISALLDVLGTQPLFGSRRSTGIGPVWLVWMKGVGQ